MNQTQGKKATLNKRRRSGKNVADAAQFFDIIVN